MAAAAPRKKLIGYSIEERLVRDLVGSAGVKAQNREKAQETGKWQERRGAKGLRLARRLTAMIAMINSHRNERNSPKLVTLASV